MTYFNKIRSLVKGSSRFSSLSSFSFSSSSSSKHIFSLYLFGSRSSSSSSSSSSSRNNRMNNNNNKMKYSSSSSSSSSYDISRYNVIVPKKSEMDKREYRIITLKNGLACILVSDAETDKAAAALSVNVGHFADPEEVPGLAHFLEHMLFLGTKKYPDESEYNRYLKDHGGQDNAWTAMHSTCYHFDVHKEHLEGALDRFAQFFICPLFTESATDREMNAVHSENENNLQSDGHRLYQLDKSLAYTNHPFHKFGTGNLSTLRDNVPKHVNVRQALLDFHKEYYSSSIMKLAIIGQENLDELMKYAEDKFSEIKNTGRKPPKYSAKVFDPKTFPLLLKIVPVKEQRELLISWPMESVEGYFMERPESLLASCLADEGPGSVLSLLKNLGYATELMAGFDYNTPEFSLFRVSIALTPEGLNQWEKVVEIVYHYIAKMNEIDDKKWAEYWEERKKIKNMNFAFKSKEAPYHYATSLSDSAHRYPLENLLECMNGLYFKCDTKLVKRLLKYLHTDNCLIQLIAKEFESECKESEKWYGTMYQKEKLTPEQLDSWKNLKPSEESKFLSTPLPNPYIADDFSLFCEKHSKSIQSKQPEEIWLGPPPKVILSNDWLKLWFKMDEYFKQPKLGIKFKITSPVAGNTCANRMMTTLFCLCFHEIMGELTYVFSEAGLSSDVSFDGANGINIEFFGYNQKLPLLADTVLSKLDQFEMSRERFDMNLESYKRQIQSFRKAHAHHQVTLFDNYILNHQGFSLEEMEETVNKITYEGLMRHKKKLFEKIYVEGLTYGNVETEQATGTYVDLIQKYILKNYQVNKCGSQEILEMKKGSLKVPSNGIAYTFQFKNFNPDDNNNAIQNDYFFKIDTPKDWAALRLMAHIGSVPCFDQLRTKEQLGYLVWSFPDIARGLMSFRVMIQSVVAHPGKLDERIEQFLQDFRKQLASIDPATFESNKEGIINDQLEKTKGIGQQLNHYWVEFNNGRYQFERSRNVAKEVEKLSLKDILAVYDEYILGSKGTRSKLSIQCFGRDHSLTKLTPQEMKKYNIQLLTPDNNYADIIAFKDKCGYYPFPYGTNAKL